MTQRTEHLEEKTLALFVLHAPEVEDRRKEIAAHLESCAGCAALFKEIDGYYGEVDRLQSKEEHSLLPSLEVAGRIAVQRQNGNDGPIVPFKRPVLQRFVASFRTYPVRWSGAFALVAVAALFLVPKFITKDPNPMFVRAKNEFLVAFDRNSNELWKKYVAAGFEENMHNTSLSYVSVLADVDGRGKNNTFLMLPDPRSNAKSYQPTSIACYEPDGGDRWRFEFRPNMDFGKRSFSGDYFLVSWVTVGDLSLTGRPEIPFVARHYVWWPSAVGLLDARTGNVVGEYWHPGWVRIATMDVDKNGVKELVVSGYSNAYKRNVVAVLDPRQLGGHAPATEEFTPNGIELAREKFYILLPDPDLFDLSPRVAVVENSGISPINILEVRTIRYLEIGDKGQRVAEMFFEFDEHLNCVRVRPGDEFVDIHHQLEREGKVTKKLDANYFEELRQGLQYWDGNRFVKEVKMNQRYISTK